MPFFAGAATWLFPRLSLIPHSAAEAESLPRAPFALGAFTCLMGLSLSLSLFPAALTRGGVIADYWWTRDLYQFRFHADLLALSGVFTLYLLGLILNLHFYSLPTPVMPHRRATYLLFGVGSAAAIALCVDIIATLFFLPLTLLALWLFSREYATREADRMLLYTTFGGALFTGAGLLMWRESGLTAITGFPLTLVGSAPPSLHTLGLLLLIGGLPLLAAFPVTRWLSLLGREHLQSAMVCGLLVVFTGCMVLLHLLPGSIPLPLLPGLTPIALVLGVVTFLWGAIGVWGSRSLRGLALWLTIAQSGLFLLTLGVAAESRVPATTTGLQAAVLHVFAFPLPLLTLWVLASIIQHRVGTDAYPGLSGLGPPLWLGGVIYLLAGLSLAGVPYLPGYWAQRLLLEGQPLPFLILVVLLDLCLALAVLGGFYRIFLRAEPTPHLAPIRRWMFNTLVFLLLLILAAIVLYLGPAQAWSETIARGMVTFSL